ncbi:hypothetical protein B0O99DRAFT_633823 [Bisporella sp. PMI_857]|nr:hypothetical protein B0O99DRAFT_633823 [Bisporella sp. PMI_857]
MTSYFGLDNETLTAKVNIESPDLFEAKVGAAQLLAKQVCKRTCQDITSGCVVRTKEINGVSELDAFRNGSNHPFEIFTINQERSWTTLNISRCLFEELLCRCNVFPDFWKCVFTFGRKSRENEFQFPGFRARRAKLTGLTKVDSGDKYINEAAYVLRRVELKNRALGNGESPWAIRQTGVYSGMVTSASPDDGFKSKLSRFTFILLAPSSNISRHLDICLETSSPSESFIPAWNLKLLLVGDSFRNWLDYMAYLEDQLTEQSNDVVLATVGSKKENLAPLEDFNINFEDRQNLKIIEDAIVDLQVVVSTMLKTVKGLYKHCEKSSEELIVTHEEREKLGLIFEEFKHFVSDAEMYLERAAALKDKAASTARLLSDLLSYEEAVALKDLTKETQLLSQESQLESKSMHQLTERSTKDAAAVKILTIIMLIYLPFTLVANFFSTQFVATNDDGHMKLAENVWLLAAIAIPFTIFTLMLWAGWVHFTKIAPPPQNNRPTTLPAILRCRQSSWKFIVTSTKKRLPSPPKAASSGSFTTINYWKKKSLQHDLEKGCLPYEDENGSSLQSSPQFTMREAVTWPSTATTIQPSHN